MKQFEQSLGVMRRACLPKSEASEGICHNQMLKIRYFENVKNFYLLIHFDNYLKESVNGLREGKFPDDNKELKVYQHSNSK